MKKALGKGINAFIPEEFGILKEETYIDLDIEQLSPSPFQPRMRFEDKAIDELAQSIRETGILQPIVAVREGTRYIILIGERRWRAAQKAGLRKVPVLVRHIPRERQLEASIIENVQREDLNPVEVALAFKRMIDDLGYTQEAVADKVGKDRASVANTLRLLRLPEDVLILLQEGRISMGHARAILGIEDPGAQSETARRAADRNLSVREVERLVARGRSLRPTRRAKPDPDLEALQEELIRCLGAKVSISGNSRRGTIRISYFSLDDLNRVSEILKGAGA